MKLLVQLTSLISSCTHTRTRTHTHVHITHTHAYLKPKYLSRRFTIVSLTTVVPSTLGSHYMLKLPQMVVTLTCRSMFRTWQWENGRFSFAGGMPLYSRHELSAYSGQGLRSCLYQLLTTARTNKWGLERAGYMHKRRRRNRYLLQTAPSSRALKRRSPLSPLSF